MYGLMLQHALSENTFYDVHLTYIRSNNTAKFNRYGDVPTRMCGDTIVLWFVDSTGFARMRTGQAVDNIPIGWADPRCEDNYITDVGGAEFGHSHQCGTWNTSWSQTYSGSVDFSTQLNRYNLVKCGLSFQYDKLNEFVITQDGWFWHDYDADPVTDRSTGYYINYEANPILAGLYIQDKLEFEGMFANFGLRFDYSDPNVEWPNVEDDPYSPFFSYLQKDSLFTQGELIDVSPAFQISPRIGISFPVLETSKLFFNYGHFYSLPTNDDRYKIAYGARSDKVHIVGNPELKMARTISYEVGLESSIADMFMARISGYYKDSEYEAGDMRYLGAAGLIDYYRPENIHYGDTRGFEIELRKDGGRYVSGWVNYNYMVQMTGTFGELENYEEYEAGITEVDIDPLGDRPVPQPVLRGQITLKAPQDWGMFLGGYNLSFLYSWRAGHYFTFNPFGDQFEDELENNFQWASSRRLDLSVSKDLSFGGVRANFFFDVHNLFDWKNLSDQCFNGAQPGDMDRILYFKTLKLETYNDPKWKDFWADAGYFGPQEGEEADHIGDMPDDDHLYINAPGLTHLYYLDPRYVQFGIKLSF
jgi:hypothetical protein